MKTATGLWIDHRKAVIVRLTDKDEEIKIIPSNMEKHVRYSGEAEEETVEDQRDRKYLLHLNRYYDEIISKIRDSEAIFIIGPGKAKEELKNRLEKDNLGGLIAEVETVDKMTDVLIAAKVRKYFKKYHIKTV